MSITLLLIVVTSLISYQAINDPTLKNKLLQHPFLEHHHKEYYRLITNGFVHANWVHLLVNMFVLYEFGEMKGRLLYLMLYLFTIVASSIPTHFKHKDNQYYRGLGASGATSGILFSFILFHPWSMLGLFFVIPCPAIIAAFLFLFYSSWASKNSNDNIAHDVHFYGAIFGFLFTIALNQEFFTDFLTRLVQNAPF